MISRTLSIVTILALCGFCGSGAGAQTPAAYPTRSISLVVPFPPGGAVDAMARIVAEKLSSALGQQVVVDNRGGGAGNVGARYVAKSAPDGYTLLLGNAGTTTINPYFYATAGYDPLRDFVPVGLIASMPLVMMVHPSIPAQTVQEFLSVARRSPGQLSLGTPAVGSAGYMAAELFKASTGVDITIVPYKGTGPLSNDLLGGHVAAGVNTIPPALGALRAASLRPIAVTTPERTSLLPEVPTMAEAGVPASEATIHFGVLAPAATPKTIVDRLNGELRKLTSLPDVRQRIAADGGDPMPSSGEDYAAVIRRESGKWSALIKQLGIKGD